MAIISLAFTSNVNISAQIGDKVYYSPTVDNAEFNVSTDIITLGYIVSIQQQQDFNAYQDVESSALDLTGDVVVINVNVAPGVSMPIINSSFIFFSKPNNINMSTPVGYYAQVKFVNNSKVKSEMFAAGCEVFESSK